MICNLCDNEAALFVVDNGAIRIPAHELRPGAIISCDNPKSMRAYCEDHAKWLKILTLIPLDRPLAV